MALQYQRTIDWSAGMDTRTDPDQIPENTAVDILNSYIGRPGFISTRDGVTPLGGRGTTAGGLAVWAPPGGVKQLVGIWPPSVYRSTMDTTWTQVASGASLTTNAHAAVMGRDIDGNRLLFVHGIEAGESGASLYQSGLLWVNCDDASWSQTFDLRPSVAMYWQDRLWVADSCQTDHYADQFFWSRIFDGREFSLAGMNLRVDPGYGGRITALLPARGNAPQAFIFKDTALYVFDVVWGSDGYIPLSSNEIDTTAAQIRPLTHHVGCVAGQSAIWVPGAQGADVYFLSSDGIRSLRRAQDDAAQGAAGVPLTWTIPTIIDRINWTYAHRARAATFDNYYLCSIPLDGASHPSHILVKNMLVDEFHGWSYWELPTAGLVSGDFPRPRRFFQSSTLSSDTLTGQTGTTLAAHVFELSGQMRAPGDGRHWYTGEYLTTRRRTLTTRDYDLGDTGRRKYWRWIEIEFSGTDTAATINIYGRVDDAAEWTYLNRLDVELEQRTLQLPTPLPWHFWDGYLQTQKFACESLGPGFRLQVKVEDEGRGETTIQRLEVVGSLFPKEWT